MLSTRCASVLHFERSTVNTLGYVKGSLSKPAVHVITAAAEHCAISTCFHRLNGVCVTAAAAAAGHTRWVWDCVFSVDAAYLVTASSDATARLWDLSAGATSGCWCWYCFARCYYLQSHYAATLALELLWVSVKMAHCVLLNFVHA